MSLATPVIDLSRKRSGRSVRNGLATVLMGLSLVVVMVPLVFVLVNLLVDISYALINPRIRYA